MIWVLWERSAKTFKVARALSSSKLMRMSSMIKGIGSASSRYFSRPARRKDK